MNLKLLRLKSGEDIVVELLDGKDSQQHMVVKNPAMLMPMSDGRGNQVQMGLAPWMPFSASKEYEIPKDWIIVITEPLKDIVNNYNQVFGSGIVVPEVRVGSKTLLNE